jgi:hypothetical protein
MLKRPRKPEVAGADYFFSVLRVTTSTAVGMMAGSARQAAQWQRLRE